jgi:hypothetical protein
MAARAYREAGAPQALKRYRAQGGHTLTRMRFDAIVDGWLPRLVPRERASRSALLERLTAPGWTMRVCLSCAYSTTTPGRARARDFRA